MLGWDGICDRVCQGMRILTKLRYFFWSFFRGKKNSYEIDPGEFLLDAKNMPGYNTSRLEGMFERPIARGYIIGFKILTAIVLVIFAGQLIRLQLVQGDDYRKLAEQNRLDVEPIIADRGTLVDRNGTLLAWNEIGDESNFPTRTYLSPGFGHILGWINEPAKDKNGNYWRTEISGQSGAEQEFDNLLKGKNGAQYFEVDAQGHRLGLAYKEDQTPGTSVSLSLDAGIQAALWNSLHDYVEKLGFKGGSGVIMDIETGELIAVTSYPEIDPNVLSSGTDREKIVAYNNDERTPYLNRAVAGEFIPGSIVKPYLALGALNEGIITTNTTVNSTGQVEIPNKYDPSNPQIFRDHVKGGHGVTDVYKAVAESVNTFFYAIGGGYGNQRGMGIEKIELYTSKFGIGEKPGSGLKGEKDGNIPSPEWKKKAFKSDSTWRLGDTYNSSIGQFGFLVTPLQMARAVSGMATSGTLVTPTLLHNDPQGRETKAITGIDEKWYPVIQEAMRDTVLKGTAQILNVSYVHVAGKTGTAQVGPNNKFMNSWITGYFPYENPKYTFAVLMDYGPSTNQTGSTFVMRAVLDWMQQNRVEYFGP